MTTNNCPIHSVPDCSTCYTNPGECEYGGRICGRVATYSAAHPRETRRFCELHAKSDRYAFARVGCVIREEQRQ